MCLTLGLVAPARLAALAAGVLAATACGEGCRVLIELCHQGFERRCAGQRRELSGKTLDERDRGTFNSLIGRNLRL